MLEVRPLRAGLVGLGAMGRHHARVLSTLEGVELVGILEPEAVDHLSSYQHLIVSSIDALLDRRLDYCVVAAPTASHRGLGLQLASAGVHALIEKPLASEPDAALELVEAFESRSLVGAVGHIERYNPALQAARKRVLDGQLGRLLQISTRRQGPYPARIADVGVIKDLATHDIDLTAWLSGQSYVSVSAQVAHQSGRDYEDFVVAVGRLSGGTIINHVVNWLSPVKERTTIVTGELGAFVIDTLTADLTFYANGAVDVTRDDVANFRGVREGDVLRYAISKPEPLRSEHEAFRDAVVGRHAEIVTMRDGFQTVLVAQAMLESARSGTTIKV